MNGSQVGFKAGILGQVSTCLDKAGINIESVVTSQIAIDLILKEETLEDARKQIQLLQLEEITEIKAFTNIALIAAVGQHLGSQLSR